MMSNFSIYFFTGCSFGVVYKKCLLNLKEYIFLIFLLWFLVFLLIYMIHCQLIFIFLKIQISNCCSNIDLKDYTFSTELICTHRRSIIYLYVYFYTFSSVLCICFIYAKTFMCWLIRFYNILKSRSHPSSMFLLCFKVVLAFLVFAFHMNFRIHLSISILQKSVPGFWFGLYLIFNLKRRI